MPAWLGIVVHWIHVFAGAFWFGGALFTEAVLGPALARSKPESVADIGPHLATLIGRVNTASGAVAILFGILLGTVFGPVQSVGDALGTPYGRTWIAALLLGIFLAVWGGAVVGRTAAQIPLALPGERPAIIRQVLRLSRVGIAVFVVVYTCMVLMRYGI